MMRRSSILQVTWSALTGLLLCACCAKPMQADEPVQPTTTQISTSDPAQAPVLTSEQASHSVISQRAIQLLRNRCANCHGADKQESDLRVDSRAALQQGGQRGSSLASQTSQWRESLLWRSVTRAEPELEMPPKHPLEAAELKLLEDWLAVGAPWHLEPDHPLASVPDVGDAWQDERNPVRKRFGTERLQGWSWRPVTVPALPFDKLIAQAPDRASRDEDGWAREWVAGPIDLFVAEHWMSEGAVAQAASPLSALARRVAFDLTGLPPEESWLAQLLADDRPDAYERFVDRLLASPRFGQHLARMWLDVVRYSDSNGFDWDEFRPNAWRYRDYVVRSFNRDLPYAQFIRQQLAGDLLQPEAPLNADQQDCLLATGYLRMGPHDNAAPLFNEQDRSRAELLADLTETTASAFLAQTFACCRCHDHKTDPFLQEDHYRLRAFFASIEFDDARPLDLVADQAAIAQHNQPLDERIAELDKEINPLKESKEKTVIEQRKSLEKQRQSLMAERKPWMHGLLVREKAAAEATPVFVLFQGDHRSPRQQVVAGLPLARWPSLNTLASARPAADLSTTANTTANAAATSTRSSRLVLADFIASAENPWTSRVYVNRLWQLCFGKGLVATSNDFGLTGRSPTHPELLDWLASELVQSDWSTKALLRQIVTSNSYRQQPIPGGAAEDRRSMHASLRRLSAEQMRDANLQAAGLLEHRVGGPPIWPEFPPEILQANPAFLDDNESKTKGWYPSPSSTQYARSLYLIQKRTVRLPLLETFDLPENSGSCACRESSIVAPQALSLLNGSLGIECANSLARLIAADSDGQVDRAIEAAFARVLQRAPTEKEQEISRSFLQSHSLVELARALLNTNELMFVP